MAKVMTNRRRDPAETAQMLKNVSTQVEVPKHLKAIAKGPADQTVALIFWKLRNQFPEMAIVLSEHDIKGYQDSMNYCQQTPQLIVDAKPSSVIIRIADKSTGDMIGIEENNETDLAAKELAVKTRAARDSANMLVGTARMEFSQGVNSKDTIDRLCESLTLLARQ